MKEANSNMPSGWKTVHLSDVTEPSQEKCDPSLGNTQVYIGLEHIAGGRGCLVGSGTSADIKSTKTVFRSGDVLYGKLRLYLKKVAKPDFDGICSTDILVFPESPYIANSFLLHFLSQQTTADFATQN